MTDQPAAPPAAAAPAPAAPAVTPAAPAAPTLPAAPPAELELRVPPNAGLSTDYLTGLRGVAKEHGLTQKQAQAWLDWNVAQSAAAAKSAEAAQAAERASWDALLAKDGYVGPKLAEASDRIGAYIKTHIPALHDYLMVQGVHRFPPLFLYFDGAAKAAAETGNVRQATAPAPAATANADDWSTLFTHPDSKAALAASKG